MSFICTPINYYIPPCATPFDRPTSCDRGFWTGRPVTDTTPPAVPAPGPRVCLRSNKKSKTPSTPQYVAPVRPDNTYVWYPPQWSPSWVATPVYASPAVYATPLPTVYTTPVPAVVSLPAPQWSWSPCCW
ncbi:hypothetical protein BT96DRAFT_1303 [Gymnopus androsaceus JB14]|uniref:Uncharacterized protein n=1 Tax=Gymnopus androsaceus JB14 TaxID=1447944 RepID=A0A6A4IN13_9AGAR|nr:hypothetical protein BT96DRAFT_1303 [Gymnopus androsaceus JB14]